MKHSVLLSLLLTVSLAANARTPVRPYEEWEATQFVALSGHQPSDYVAPDNNWEILYCLRTPHTPAELRATGVGCTDSQLMLLEVGGLIAEQIAQAAGVKAYIADPVVVDELDDIARLSGIPECPRISIFHALNQKAIARRHAEKVGKRYEDLNLVVAHMGGGILSLIHISEPTRH